MSSARVMVVDDDAIVLNTVGDALVGAGYTVQLSQYPTMALPTAQSFQPDVLVIDLTMPVLSGFEVVKGLSRTPQLLRTIVVFLTGQLSPREDLRGLLGGATDVWHKP